MKSDFESIAVFVRVVQDGSFTAAGIALGIGPSAVSKKVARLERQLGVSLLSRTTRKVTLTSAGQEFFNRCLIGISEISRAEEALQEHLDAPRGLLRLKVPRGFGRHYIAPIIPKFMAIFPLVEVELTLGNWDENFMDKHIDVIISAVDPPNINLVSRTLAHFERITCASPVYINRHGMPREPRDLLKHNCLIFTDSRSFTNEWTYYGKDGVVDRVRVSGNFRTNSTEAMCCALAEGLGIAHMPISVIGHAVASGQVEIIFRDGSHGEHERPSIKAYYPPAKLRLPKIKLFVDFLTDSIRDRNLQDIRLLETPRSKIVTMQRS